MPNSPLALHLGVGGNHPSSFSNCNVTPV